MPSHHAKPVYQPRTKILAAYANQCAALLAARPDFSLQPNFIPELNNALREHQLHLAGATHMLVVKNEDT